MSDVFKPSLRAVLPTDWFAKESMTLLSPDGQANVIASSEPLDPSIGSAQYAETQGRLLAREFPHFHQAYFGPRRVFGGRAGWIRVFSWMPPDGVPVSQIQLYYAERGRGYTATATTPSTQFARHEHLFRECLDGLSLGGTLDAGPGASADFSL